MTHPICSFSTTDTKPKSPGRRLPSYEQVKAEVLAAGRFSVFEAGERPAIFMRLEKDPELETFRDPPGCPWIGVRRVADSDEQEGR